MAQKNCQHIIRDSYVQELHESRGDKLSHPIRHHADQLIAVTPRHHTPSKQPRATANRARK